MGNNQSSDSRPRGAPPSHLPSSSHAPAAHSSNSSSSTTTTTTTNTSSNSHHRRTSHDLHPVTSRASHREPRRRESVQAAFGFPSPAEKVGKAPPAAPSASTATAEPFKSSGVQKSSARRAGSVASVGSTGGGGSSSSSSRVQHASSRSEGGAAPLEQWPSTDTGSGRMGNEQSKPKDGAPLSRQATREASGGSALSRQATREDAGGSTLSRQTTREAAPQPLPLAATSQAVRRAQQQQPAGPVDVPSSPAPAAGAAYHQHPNHGFQENPPLSPTSPISPTQSASYTIPVAAGFSRPPRLPLPIEEEEYIPGSPVLSPSDLQDAVEPLGDIDSGPQRTRSMLSGTTVDDDADEMEDGGLVGEAQGPSVPTMIEWRGSGEKVYVTGTFAAWDRKFRLHKDGPSKHEDALSVTINLQPGTHHLKFIVDGDMRLSDHLPTAVDYTNILVNYIEVSADDRPTQLTSAIQARGAPVIPPGTEPIPIRAPPVAVGTASMSATDQKHKVPSHIRPPQVLPPTPELQGGASARPQTPAKAATPAAADAGEKPPAKTASGRTESRSERMATRYYHNVVPKYLLDGDLPEDTLAHRNADAVCDTLPTPPTLPLFLSKSVLNGAMPMKDDASVLIMPNHTVLNHLATSSIRGGTLATSATTRYKQKFLTTIIYKPTADYGD